MAYLGNTPTSQNFTSGTDYFNGNGSTVAFTLSRQVSSINDVIVVIENVVQKPLDAYGIVGTTLTFTSAPPSGTNNIYVRYVSTITTAITPNDLSVTTQKIADASITTEKVADNTITTEKVADNHITVGKLHTTVLQPANISDKANTSTGYFDLPAGTTAQRPASPHVGMSRFNTTTGLPEWYSATFNAWISFADAPYSIEYIIVAGGGSGGSDRGGGGGAGGYLSGTLPVSVSTQYPIALGAGGSGGVNTYANGNNTTALGLIAIGGGGGGSPYASAYTNKPNGGNGGSGGGGSSQTPWSGGSGTAGQGNNGGNGTGSSSSAGGGGGAGIAGGSASGNVAGNGGYGNYDTWTGPRYLAAGGGGASGGGGTAGSGGTGGGGSGSAGDGNQTAGNASANTGSGGGGATGGGAAASGSGASGIVIIRYLGTQRGTGGSVTTSGLYTIHTFTSSGTYTA